MLPLVELKPSQCRYPFGKRDFKFCGLTTEWSSVPYCAEHAAIAYRPADAGFMKKVFKLTLVSSLAA
jgi:hypothetical protein